MIFNFKKKLSRINNVTKIYSDFYLKKPGKKFIRCKHEFDPVELIKIEIECLQRLDESRHFPDIVSNIDKSQFIMTNNGSVINKNNVPFDCETQISEIITELENYNIVHRDIKVDNLLVGTNGTISLIDFGWAMIDNDYYRCSRDLLPIDKRMIYDNEFALRQIVESIK